MNENTFFSCPLIVFLLYFN